MRVLYEQMEPDNDELTRIYIRNFQLEALFHVQRESDRKLEYKNGEKNVEKTVPKILPSDVLSDLYSLINSSGNDMEDARWYS